MLLPSTCMLVLHGWDVHALADTNVGLTVPHII